MGFFWMGNSARRLSAPHRLPTVLRLVLVPEVGLETPPGIESTQVVGFAIGAIVSFCTFEGKLVQNWGQGALRVAADETFIRRVEDHVLFIAAGDLTAVGAGNDVAF